MNIRLNSVKYFWHKRFTVIVGHLILHHIMNHLMISCPAIADAEFAPGLRE